MNNGNLDIGNINAANPHHMSYQPTAQGTDREKFISKKQSQQMGNGISKNNYTFAPGSRQTAT
jgi:hypothetical protein